MEELNARGVVKYSDFGPIEGYISETVHCKIGGKLVLITSRKSYMSFRLVPKLVTLNGVVALILRYFTQFGSFRGAMRKSVRSRREKKFTFAISSPDEFLVYSSYGSLKDHWKWYR